MWLDRLFNKYFELLCVQMWGNNFSIVLFVNQLQLSENGLQPADLSMVAESSLTLLDLGQPSQPSTDLPDMNLVIESDLGNLGSISVLARNRRTTWMTSASSITENEKSNTVNDEYLSRTAPKSVKKNSSEAKKNRKDEKRVDSLTRKKTKETGITSCTTCGIRYCDSSSQSWIQCQKFEAWHHNACQGLDEKGPATFICILCIDDGARRRRRTGKKKNWRPVAKAWLTSLPSLHSCIF